MFSNYAKTFLGLHRDEIDKGSQNLDKILTALNRDTMVPGIEKQYLAFLIAYTLAGKKRFGIVSYGVGSSKLVSPGFRYTVVVTDDDQLTMAYRLSYWSVFYPEGDQHDSADKVKADLEKTAIRVFGEKHRAIYTEILNDIFENARFDIIGV